MGKALDVVLIIVVLVGALYVAHRLGLTAGEIWTWAKSFWYGGGGTNTTAGMILK
jgi:hypothetical protein